MRVATEPGLQSERAPLRAVQAVARVVVVVGVDRLGGEPVGRVLRDRTEDGGKGVGRSGERGKAEHDEHERAEGSGKTASHHGL